jgi:hypothetical protein
MNVRRVKIFAFALALATGFASAPGLWSLSAVQAQPPPVKVMRPPPRELEYMRKIRRQLEMQEAYHDGIRSAKNDLLRGLRYSARSHAKYQNGSNYYRTHFQRGYHRYYYCNSPLGRSRC